MPQDSNHKQKSVKEIEKTEIRPTKPSLPKRIVSQLKQTYISSPLNFSTLTGWRYPGIPRLLGNPLLGKLPDYFTTKGVWKNLIAAGKLASDHPSGMCYYWIAHRLVLLVTKPEQIKQVLIENDKNISRRSATRFAEFFWGSSITTDPYDLWKKKKAIYNVFFAEAKALKQYESQMHLIVNKYLQDIEAQRKNAINLRQLLSHYTLDMVLSLMIPYEPARDVSNFADYTSFVGDNVANIRNVFKWSLPSIIRKILFRNEITNKEQVRDQMKRRFRELLLDPYASHIKNTDNFLRGIWELRKEDPENTALESNVNVFGDGNALLFAAQDTVTSTLEFIIKLLSAHPKVEEKLRTELTEQADDELSMESINKIEYLDMIIKEAMRLYPAAPLLPRGVDTGFKIDNIPLFKGDLIVLSPYITHRLENIWENPQEFNPERFSKRNAHKVLQHAYFPFGDGRHGCVGWRLAFQQIKLLLTVVYLRYQVKIPDNDFELTFDRTTIRPKNITMAYFVPLQADTPGFAGRFEGKI